MFLLILATPPPPPPPEIFLFCTLRKDHKEMTPKYSPILQ